MLRSRYLIYFAFISSLFAKEIIAVLDLDQIGLTPQEAQILTQRLTTKLISLDKYQVVERTNIDKILKEQKFQHSGCTDSECAVQIGQLLNTDFIVIGSVNKFGKTYAVDARLIDVGSGKSLISAEFSMKGEIDALLTTGITSIAKQLYGKEAKTSLLQSPTQSTTYTPTYTKSENKNQPTSANKINKTSKKTELVDMKKRGDWYFSFINYGLLRYPAKKAYIGHSDVFHIRFKNFQYKHIVGNLCRGGDCTGYDQWDGIQDIEYQANGFGISYSNEKMVNEWKPWGDYPRWNIWYFYDAKSYLAGYSANTEIQKIKIPPFCVLSVTSESNKWSSFGYRFEYGLLFFVGDPQPNEFWLEGFYLSCQINILSFGSNY